MGIGIGVVSEGQLICGAHYTSGELRSVFWKRHTRGNQVGTPLERLLTIQNSLAKYSEEHQIAFDRKNARYLATMVEHRFLVIVSNFHI